ncbi:hypothetical protein, partial [Klebsiella pneumoniae]|uniref:hypothetical protein n=1 Tax=Klebsiella pneumoniae TaxID=573 RepID=UPI002A09053C
EYMGHVYMTIERKDVIVKKSFKFNHLIMVAKGAGGGGFFLVKTSPPPPPPLWLPVHYTFFFTQCQYMG